jgi:hypothetical protein
MTDEIRIVVIEIGTLRETIREIIREEFERQKALNTTQEPEYKDTDRLSIMQVAAYLGVSRKTVDNYRQARLIPEPEYNLSGKPRWTVAQLKEAVNSRKAKHKFPLS